MRSLAPLIKTCLLDLEIKVNVTVRQKRKELHILLESTNFGDRQLLVDAIAKCCYDYEDRNFKAARIYAFWFGQPLPQWIERIEFEQEKASEEINLRSLYRLWLGQPRTAFRIQLKKVYLSRI